MDLYETNTHSFIVKIWLEETIEESGRAIWRGHITHVPSGERRALKDLNDILIFIRTYLAQIEVEPGKFWRLRRWLRRWK
jgi:hypothetical protein